MRPLGQRLLRQAGGQPVAPQAVVRRDASTGPRGRTVTVGRRPLAVAVAARTGRIFVANSGSNSVSVLDARSGLPLRTVPVPVGTYPDAVAVDARTERVF